ncbi:uncharacterized protein LOC131626871 [Vicia villosa]|uniref:uncharacterized protein LOC131626871 n=1 Tax=Vicia villosa TaxID=3911 RepID=UPI00273C8866|nr:uncharacterized protein LOC131626871 [Vicia villosa]
MDEVIDHWKKLRFDDFEPAKEGESKITVSDELEEIMDKFSKAGAPKKPKSKQEDTSTKWDPSYFEHVDTLIPDPPTPKSKCSANKGDRISKPPRTPPTKKPLMIYIDEMPLFMHKFIDNIVDVGTDGNCRYRAIAGLLGRGEENHTLIRQALISELTLHRDMYD